MKENELIGANGKIMAIWAEMQKGGDAGERKRKAGDGDGGGGGGGKRARG